MRELFPPEDSMKASIADELRKQQLDFTEAAMIRVLEDDTYTRHLKWKAAIGLRDCGTEHCIPALKAILDYPNEDVKSSAILTIAHIGMETELDFLAALLDRKKLRKGIVLQALMAIDNEQALPAVIRYLAKTLKTDKRPSSLKVNDVAYGLIFLDRHRTAEAREILEGYGKIWNKFDYFVQKSLKSETAFYREFIVKR
jgi:HEAT repeat protein